MSAKETGLSSIQQICLVLLRTLVGWHFLYEGYYKLWWPAWSREGAPLAHWTSAGYLRAASGPFASAFHALADSPWLGAIDMAVCIGLVLVGLSLILGLFTQTGCVGALALLAMFYVSAIPTAGVPQQGAEGAYLLVNKNLIEAGAVVVLLVFRTGRLAGIDRLWLERRPLAAPAQEAAS